MSGREMSYVSLVVLGAVVPWYFNLQHIGAGGGLLADFFSKPFAEPLSSSLLVDLLIAFAAYNVWLFSEGRRMLSSGQFWLCVFVSWVVAFASGLPLYLLLRERQLRLAQG
jgi:hypothetical protein